MNNSSFLIGLDDSDGIENDRQIDGDQQTNNHWFSSSRSANALINAGLNA